MFLNLMNELLGYASSDSGTADGSQSPKSRKKQKLDSNPDQATCAAQTCRAATALKQSSSGAQSGAPGHPLPSAAEVFRDEEIGGTVTGDLHQGRVRSFAHVEGNYATHVYITVAVPEGVRPPLERFLGQVRAFFPSLHPVQAQPADPHPGMRPHAPPGAAAPTPGILTSGTGAGAAGAPLAQAHYHISLSRSTPVRLAQIDSLTAALRKELRRLDPFKVAIGGVQVLANEDRTRTFLALAAAACGGTGAAKLHPQHAPARRQPHMHQQRREGSVAVGRGGGTTEALAPGDDAASALERAIEAVNRAFQRHGLPRFYDPPRPHISVGWLLGDWQQHVERALGAAEAPGGGGRGPLLQALAQLRACCWQAQVDKIQCRSGQRVSTVWEGHSGAGQIH